MDLPRISVVTPSFNQASFLEQTILSVLGQCYPNLEYIVMDGGSSDGSAEIIARYRSQLAYSQSQRDGGQAAAINAGFARATGDILCWLNSDDFFLPGALHRVAKGLAGSASKAALVYGSCLFFREGANASAKILTARSFNAERLRATAYIVQPSAFWTRELWEKTGPLDETLSYAFDWDWFIRASQYADFVPYAEMFAAYRRHDAHKSGQGGEARRAELLAVAQRHGSDRVRRLYEFASEQWPSVTAWTRRRRTMESWHFPAAGAAARLTVPALWRLPAGVVTADLHTARAMLEGV
ncbi:MAG: glycosyl transferase family 2 [Chthoniobacter sp.]|nr:glycosyl transferase family 2 [Chthoniobacter sp.]